MLKHHFFGFEVEIDQESTRRWYATAEEWGCDCGDCRNFLALAHEKRLPSFVLEPLDKLGIPPEKATYVCQMYPDGDGQHYQFSYRITGFETVKIDLPHKEKVLRNKLSILNVR